MLFSFPQSGVNARHIVIVLIYFTLVCNVKSVLVEIVTFAMVEVKKFCKKQLIAVRFKLFDGKDAGIVVSKSKR